MSIYITGDTHNGAHNPAFPGRHDMSKIEALLGQLGMGDILIIVGDTFGTDPMNNRHWIDWLTARPWTTVFIDGNHENYDVLRELPTRELFNADVGQLTNNIFHLRRGRVYTIEGLKIFAFGGAESADKHLRFSGVDWWPEEVPTQREVYAAFDNLAEVNNMVDIVITHAAPRSVVDHALKGVQAGKITDPTCEALESFWEGVTFDCWFCGHYHTDLVVDRFRFLYQDVVKIS